MTEGSVDEALIAYKKVHRALLTSTASRWRHLDISMQQLRAIYLLRDEEVATVGLRLAGGERPRGPPGAGRIRRTQRGHRRPPACAAQPDTSRDPAGD